MHSSLVCIVNVIFAKKIYMSIEGFSDHLNFVLNVALYSLGNKFGMSLLRVGWAEVGYLHQYQCVKGVGTAIFKLIFCIMNVLTLTLSALTKYTQLS